MSTKLNAILAVTLTAIVSTQAQAGNNVGYWFDSSNKIVRTGFGECWRTIEWSESNAIAECEGGMAKKVVAMVTDGDSDNDGVVDSKDQCKNTVMGAEVNSKGCVVDSDNDGVADSKDVCKDTVKGAEVDSKGCAIDSDKDGIADVSDDCAGTTAGTVVNTRGCELKANISLDNVQFRTGTAELSSDSRSVLDEVATVLLANKHL